MAPRGRGSGDSDWSGNDDKAAMECFYGLVRDTAKICFGCSHDTVRPDGHVNICLHSLSFFQYNLRTNTFSKQDICCLCALIV